MEIFQHNNIMPLEVVQDDQLVYTNKDFHVVGPSPKNRPLGHGKGSDVPDPFKKKKRKKKKKK
jgi:hypothetical protein